MLAPRAPRRHLAGLRILVAILILLVAGVILPWRLRPRSGNAGKLGLTGAAVSSVIGRLALGILAAVGLYVLAMAAGSMFLTPRPPAHVERPA